MDVRVMGMPVELDWRTPQLIVSEGVDFVTPNSMYLLQYFCHKRSEVKEVTAKIMSINKYNLHDSKTASFSIYLTQVKMELF